jgi:rSAM/selenodomain-associated transferase 1
MTPQFLPESQQIAVFGRIPRPGAGKTRLARRVGVERAAELARAFLLDGLDRSLALAPEGTWFYVAPEAADATAATLAAARELVDARVHVALQEGPHLGARMDHALAALCAHGPSVLIGADVPDLPPAFIQQAMAWLAGPSRAPRLVLGPAADGGFVLIGADRAPGAMLRDEPEWGTAGVCARTRRLAAAATPPWQVRELEAWWDVDEAEDLAALADRLGAAHTAGSGAAAGWPRRTAALFGYFPAPGAGAGAPPIGG